MEVFELIAEVGLPIASGLIMGFFIFLVMKQIMDGLVDEIKTIQGITKMLITRATIMNNDMIRLHQKVNVVLELREKEMQNETAEPKNKNEKGVRRVD